MKTSNQLILAALLLVLVSLIGFDYSLKKEFVSGRYKDPYRSFVALKFKNFDVVDINSSTAANVKFVQGPFSIRIDSNALEYARIKQQGKRLQIDADFKQNYRFNPNPYLLVISCPELVKVNTNAAYTASHKLIIDTIVRDEWNMRKVLIDGFTQDSLSISQDYGSTVVLANNHIRSVNAVIGKSQGSLSKIIVDKSNRFQDITLDIRNKSKLLLDNAVIGQLNYHLADSAKLILTGSAQNILKKQ
ncbi:MAG: hypothetical protein JWP78_1929 [Mucilaginibacter sp.]|nr:hypothetical protein [Mucilaginibacter sp.]